MSDSDWNSLETVVLTGSVADLRASRLPEQAAAFVVDCPEPHAALAELIPRTGRPLIMLADSDEAGAAELVEAGADDVLVRTASFSEVMRAARHAAARRTRTERNSETPAPILEEGIALVTAAGRPSANGVAPEKAPHPRTGGPKDMPPQLQAVARLAGGIAHDFNNLLQVIGGKADSLVHELELGDSRREAAQAIADAARRAATLTQQLLAFGRRQTLIATTIDVSALITESLAHLRGRVGPGVQIVTTLTSGLPPVHADRSQILEVLSNLASNAGEAMPAGGTLSVSTDVVNVDEQMQSGRPWLRPGRFVRIQMADTGAGIEAQALPHLFEPFFSTKPQWGGTGLGLSSVYGVIKQSGGFIWVDSELGRGTRITILLPTAAETADKVAAAPTARGHVMLVEDDESVRDLLTGVLNHYGYEVSAYGSAEEALEHRSGFDLLLSDVLLPGMNGPDLAKELRRTRPGVAVLLMSGDTGHVVDTKELDARGFLQKPFSARTLVARVEELIAQSRGQRPPSSDR